MSIRVFSGDGWGLTYLTVFVKCTHMFMCIILLYTPNVYHNLFTYFIIKCETKFGLFSVWDSYKYSWYHLQIYLFLHTFNFSRYLQRFLQSSWSSLHFYYQYMRIPGHHTLANTCYPLPQFYSFWKIDYIVNLICIFPDNSWSWISFCMFIANVDICVVKCLSRLLIVVLLSYYPFSYDFLGVL